MDIDFISQLLKQLLEAQSPEVGARLKQRLNALLTEKNLPKFDERSFGFQKFRKFLEKTQGSLLEIDRQNESSDIVVSLKAAAAPVSAPSVAEVRTPEHTLVRSDVWQAFASPDLLRKRFINKESLAVRHYLEGQPSEARDEVEAAREKFQEIPPIPSAQHLSWMREFLSSITLLGADRTALEALLQQPYSSALNSAFTRALGEREGIAWRHFRTQRVMRLIDAWANANGIDPDKLRKSSTPVRKAAAATKQAPNGSSRALAVKLLELLSEEDIARQVVPVMLSTIWVRSGV